MMMLINQYPDFRISSSVAKNINNNKQEIFDMINYHKVNQLMVTSTIKQTEPSPQPSTNL